MNKTEELLRANIERIDAEIKHLVKVVNYYLGERLPFLTIEFDCPACKHITLANERIENARKLLHHDKNNKPNKPSKD